MKKFSLKATLGISGFALLTVGVAVDSNVFNFSNLALRLSNASTPTPSVTLDDSNSPTLSGGAGSRVDEKGVTWTYSGCASYETGHVTINPNGYFCVSSATSYGYTGIESITAKFTKGEKGELWLFTSINGTDWVEREILTTEIATTLANDWRFVRFLNYDPDGNAINIKSIVINYKCTGESIIEDNDSAKARNIIDKTTNLTVTDTNNSDELSPRIPGASTSAIKVEKSGTASTNFILSFGRTYLMKEIIDKKIEFDLKWTYKNFKRTINLVNPQRNTFGNELSTDKSSLKWENFQGDWYHVEAPISYFYSLISGYNGQDIPASDVATLEVIGIKLNLGACVIDNFRISEEPCELGIHNATFTCKKNRVYWVKIDWSGKLNKCEMTFSGDGSLEQVSPEDPKIVNGSPFYVRGLELGEVTITAKVYSGFNKTAYKEITTTITVID